MTTHEPKYSVTLWNSCGMFDAAKFDDLTAALRWAEGRGGVYRVYVNPTTCDENEVCFVMNNCDPRSRLYATVYTNIYGVMNMRRQEIVMYIARRLAE